MSNPLPVLKLDQRTYDRALSCVHCGLCLAACPTYLQTRHEADSPRGRIQLIRGLADGAVQPTPSVRQHLDLCLDCRACETACPSNVVYHELIEAYRIEEAKTALTPFLQRIYRWLCFNILVHPARLKLALLSARLLRLKRLPPGPIWPAPLAEQTRVVGEKKATVAFFAGCVGSVLFDSVNKKAVDLLAAAGAECCAPPSQQCCGAIHYHGGSRSPAEEMARRNIDALMPQSAQGQTGRKIDFIVSTAAGCGSMLHEYGTLLRDDPNYAARAAEFSAKVRDVTQVLDELGLSPMKHTVKATATYHDACHLAHAQRVTQPPRRLLAAIPGLNLIPLPQSDQCCGAAGTYFLTQPEMAQKLAARKLENIQSTGATYVVAGNAGCALHLRSQAQARDQQIKIVHPVELLHAAVFGSRLE